MLKIVIVGYGEMFTNLIAGALDAKCEVVGVLRKDTLKYPKWLKKIKDIIYPSQEYNYIKSCNIHEIECQKGVNSDEFRKVLLKLNPDLILVGSWGEKFSKETFSIPKIATINAHPSLLPKYRGPNPYFWVIKNQEQKSGITFHLIDEDFDTGAILAQEEFEVSNNETGASLKTKTVLKARILICKLLTALQEDIIIPLKQRNDRASYYSHPEGFELDFKKSANENGALIRASYPWNDVYFYHNVTALTPDYRNISIKENVSSFTDAGTIVEVDAEVGKLSVLCGDGKIISFENIKLLKKQDRPFTKNYLRLDVKVGDVLF